MNTRKKTVLSTTARVSCLLLAVALLLGNKDCNEDPPQTGVTDDGGIANGNAGTGSGSAAGSGGSTAGNSASAGKSGGDAPAIDGGAAPAADGGDAPLCGTRGGVQCSEQQFCKYDAAAACGTFDAGGHCATKPELCPELYAPVCGCDGETYSSDCFANAAGVSVRSEGECGAATTDPECKVVKGEPKACPALYKPVCGCDHKTYSNACSAGVISSVLHDGMCTEADCKAVGGRAVFGTGPAPMCGKNEKEYTNIGFDDGSLPLEGALCCVPE